MTTIRALLLVLALAVPSGAMAQQVRPEESQVAQGQVRQESSQMVQMRQADQGNTDAEDSTRPIPDPTTLTTQQLRREILLLREIIETRLGGMDKAIELLQTTTDRIPASIEASFTQLQELTQERFASIETQFKERDTRTDQTSRDNKVAIDAALQAQKESVDKQNESNTQAIAKQEAAFTKQIDGLSVLIQATAKASDDKIDDLKARVTSIEGQKIGTSDNVGLILGVGGLALAIGGVVIAAISLTRKPHSVAA